MQSCTPTTGRGHDSCAAIEGASPSTWRITWATLGLGDAQTAGDVERSDFGKIKVSMAIIAKCLISLG